MDALDSKKLLLAFLLLVSFIPAEAVPINKDAKAIGARFPKYNPKKGNVGSASREIGGMISAINKTGRNSSSSIRALLSKALDFREDIGSIQGAVSMAAILDAWETAADYGAFDRKGGISDRASRGRFEGEKLVWENIIPAKYAPEFAGYVGNVRLVPVDQKRDGEKPLDVRELAFLDQLKRIGAEHVNQQKILSPIGLSKAEEEERYQQQVREAGDLVERTPGIRLEGQRLSSPSAINGHRHRLRFEVSNLSRHPTEIEVVSKIYGYTDNENILYEMATDSRKLKMRRGAVEVFEVFSKSEGSYRNMLKTLDPKKSTKVYYRGYTMVAKFRGEVVATHASDGRLIREVKEEHGLDEDNSN